MSELVPENDEFGVRKIYLDSLEKKFEIPTKRSINTRKYQSERGREKKNNKKSDNDKNGQKVPTTEYDLLTDQDQRDGKSGPEFVDQEVTGYFKFSENKYTKKEKHGKGTGLSIKLRGGLHPGGKEMKKEEVKKDSARCYEIHFEYYGNNNQCLQKEYPHNNYDKKPKDFEKHFILPSLFGKWYGFKAVTINEDNGVRCEAYVDIDGFLENNGDKPANNWKLWYKVVDDGNLFSKSDETKEPFFTHYGKRRTFLRLDRVDHDPEHKFLSVRAISKVKTAYGQDITK